MRPALLFLTLFFFYLLFISFVAVKEALEVLEEMKEECRGNEACIRARESENNENC